MNEQKREMLAEWERRCADQNVRCYVCGAKPNTWCWTEHYPHAVETVNRLKFEAEAAAREVMHFDLAMRQRPGGAA